jgi:methylenetetrahydrofolate reductase (NADPH)
MRIADCFGNGAPVFSFEFFPPKSNEGLRHLEETLAELAELDPTFVSVTYGAGGSTRELTIELTARIRAEFGIETMAHVTCVGHSAAELGQVLNGLRDAGVSNVLALRGDPPRGESAFVRPVDGFAYASELTRFIRAGWDFCVGGACYPEKHVECPDYATGLEHLRQKVAAGAEFLITQLFFSPGDYFRFVDDARAAGVELPIVPGIMPITNVGQIERFTTMCGASIPRPLKDRLEAVRDDDRAVVEVGIDWATDQCRELLRGGAPGIHFYTLNRSQSTRRVFNSLRAGP